MLQPASNSLSTPKPSSQFSSGPSAFAATTEQATIGRSLAVKGEVTGSESLYIDGRVEGTISLPDHRVTIGRNGSVTANITAKEVVVMGKVSGNLHISDRLDIRSEGSLTGDVVAARLSIEDGAFFKGSVDLKKASQKDSNQAHPAPAPAAEKPAAMSAAAGART